MSGSLSGGDGSLDVVSVLLSHKSGEFDELVGVGPLVIVPGDQLDELGAELDTSLSVEAVGDWI